MVPKLAVVVVVTVLLLGSMTMPGTTVFLGSGVGQNGPDPRIGLDDAQFPLADGWKVNLVVEDTAVMRLGGRQEPQTARIRTSTK